MKSKNLSKQIGLWSGVAAFLFIVFFVKLKADAPQISFTLAIASIMAIWWVTEAVPISITALLPVVLFPVLGVMSGKDVAVTYFNNVIFLFIGGFLIAGAMEKYGLHKRIALNILLVTGSGFGSLLFGFMLATFFLSAWMSNTATAIMLVPVAISVISKFEDYLSPEDLRKVSHSLLFGVAYSASIGGISTLVGTPPNLAFIKILSIMFPDMQEISFVQWMIFATPIAVLMFVSAWLLLYYKYKPAERIKVGKNIFTKELSGLGKASYEEKIVLIAFVSVALLWITRSGLKAGSFEISGWSSFFANPKMIDDGTVAVFVALLLFIIPQKDKKKKLIGVDAVMKLPWNIVLLFGGGFALAKGFTVSGLDVWLGEQIKFVEHLPVILVIFLVALFMSFLTELTSNTASTQMFLPILAGISTTAHINPLILMLPATVAASLAFMLPVATPPNVIVFGTKRLKIVEMIKTGFWLNIIGVVIVTFGVYFIGKIVFHF